MTIDDDFFNNNPKNNGEEKRDEQVTPAEKQPAPERDFGYRPQYDWSPVPPVEEPKPTKSKKKGVIITLIILALLLLLLCCGGCVAGIALVKNKNVTSGKQTTAHTQDDTSLEASSETEKEEKETEKQSETQKKEEVTEGTGSGAGLSVEDSDYSYDGVLNLSDMIESVLPSVVCVNIQYEVQYGQGLSGDGGQASGSGVVISQDDDNIYIVTNNHVVSEDGGNNNYSFFFDFSSTTKVSSMKVVFADGTEAEAIMRGTDEEKDLAVIAVPKSSLNKETIDSIRLAKFGDSSKIRLGEPVVAIGNAMGYGTSVTQGIVSALKREVTFSDGYTRTLMQTDAAINPGNSGGGLFNVNGELVGINSAKLSDTNVEGMGYTIPITEVSELITELVKYKPREELPEEKQGYLGIYGTDIDSRMSQVYGIPEGVYISSLVEDGAAEEAGLCEKDVIRKIDDKKISTMDQLKSMLKTYEAGSTVTITYSRLTNGGYEEKEVKVVLHGKPEETSESQE